MAGYAALERVSGVRLGRPAAAPVAAPTPALAGGGDARWVVVETAASSRAGRLRDAVRDLADRARETWAITTFYLFDPDSWR